LLASILSLVPGLGQIYVGYYQRGFIHAITVVTLIAFAANADATFGPPVGFFVAFFWLYNIIDAGRRATLYNLALAGGTEMELPEDLVAFGMRGSILGGSLLIVGGFLLLMHTKFDVPMEWVADWWPVGPMIFGVYLLAKAVQERGAGGGPTASGSRD